MKSDYLRFTLVWLALVAATLVAWSLGHQPAAAMGGLPTRIMAGILGVAFVKVALVMAYFMELRRAPYVLGAIALLWIVGECSVLVWFLAG